jgi:hypothetical protein
MAKKEMTPYQEAIVRRYYDNRDNAMHQKLAELVSDLYLAEGKKRALLWKRVDTALTNLGVHPAKIAQIIEQDDPERLAIYVEGKSR